MTEETLSTAPLSKRPGKKAEPSNENIIGTRQIERKKRCVCVCVCMKYINREREIVCVCV